MTTAPLSLIAPLLCALAAPAVAEDPASESIGPRIHVAEPAHDFGPVLQGEVEEHTFRIENTGDQDLDINFMRPNCGCAVARMMYGDPPVEIEIPKNFLIGSRPLVTLKPNEHLDVEVRYDSSGQPPRTLRKHIEVLSSDPNTPRLQLELVAHVQLSVTIQPREIKFDYVPRGVGATTETIVRAAPDFAFELTGVENQDAVFSAAIDPLEEKDGKAWRVKVTIAKDAPVGNHSTTLLLRNDHERLDPLKLVVTAAVSPPVRFDTKNQFNSQLLDFKRITAGHAHSRQIVVTNMDPSVPYRITGVEVDSPVKEFVTTEVETVEEGVSYKVNVTVSEQIDARFFKGTIRILADHPEAPETNIVFSGSVLGR